MLEFYEKRKLKRILYTWPVVLVLFLVVLYMGQNVWSVFVIERSAVSKKADRATVLHDLEGRKNVLEVEIERLDTDRGVEEEIRSKFEVSKEGEGVIILLDKKDDDPEVEKKKGLFWWIVDLF